MTTIREYRNRDDWIADGKKYIGSSRARGILGHGYAGENALAVYADIVSDEPQRISEAQQHRFLIGQLFEPGILDAYSAKTGIMVHRYKVPSRHLHPSVPHVAVSLDAWISSPSGNEVVEAKCVWSHMAHEWRGEHPPLKHSIQLQCQLMTTGWARGHLVGLVDGELTVFTIERNDKFCDWLAERIERFWHDHILARIPPHPDGSDASAEAIRRLYPVDHGQVIDLGDSHGELVERLDRIKARQKKLEALRGEAENRLRMAMQDASYGVLPDGRCVSLKLQERRGYFVEPTSFRKLFIHKSIPKEAGGLSRPRNRRAPNVA